MMHMTARTLLAANRSIHYDLKESDIVTLFSTFGAVIKSEMSMDSMTGRSKGFCFIEFADPSSAEAAMAMDGFELAGRKVSVTLTCPTSSALHDRSSTMRVPRLKWEDLITTKAHLQLQSTLWLRCCSTLWRRKLQIRCYLAASPAPVLPQRV